ncbi:hypothetical protein [Lamprocystis purpurea]|jgi:2-keto-3-deoxy-6-phosphogluconate aldolase|uniref:hypothetical protein n=1 Tax=Lamprocystis purpurea TaxID=61598 RepID=UPI0012FBC834|nr:hypothetical protein [Lamprocystis purpurea]
MSISDFLARLIPSGLEKIPPADQSKRNDEIVRAVTQRNAEGSVLLGAGRLLTAEDKRRAFEELHFD